MERILEMLSKVEKYINMAKRPGVEHVVAVTPNEIVFDSRTLLKCMFGCSDWGKGCTCPSREGALKPWELEPMLRKYKTVLIIHSTSKRTAQEASYEVEIEAYLDGDALAFSMSDCAICEECAGRADQPCRDVTHARPAFHSVGIDVFATAKNLNLPLKALRNADEQQNWYSAVWLN
jgi:predicted metal-binding protein